MTRVRMRDDDDDEDRIARDGEVVRVPMFLMDNVQRAIAVQAHGLHDGMGTRQAPGPATCSAALMRLPSTRSRLPGTGTCSAWRMPGGATRHRQYLHPWRMPTSGTLIARERVEDTAMSTSGANRG